MSKPIDWQGVARQWAEFRGWKIEGVWWTHPEKGMVRLDCEPEFDRSVDDLLVSLPAGWYADINADWLADGTPSWMASIRTQKVCPLGHAHSHDTAAHALLMACVKAMEEERDRLHRSKRA